mgnify:CR=1 FL=1
MVHESVQDYYGRILNQSSDLQTNACCTGADIPAHLKTIMGRIHDEVITRYYGCGLIMPPQLEGARILDLGCGAGRDVYVLSALVGEQGEVVGVDMTPQQLEVARRHQAFHAEAFGHARSNVRFIDGYIEKLDELDLEPGSFDIIVSNCVINLSPDKMAVLAGACRLLKPGGELYFSDVYSDRRVPRRLVRDSVLYGECLSGALYWRDFLHLAKQAGFDDPRLVESAPITIENPEQQAKVGDIRFCSATYRLFRSADLEPGCEDYGHKVRYQGTVSDFPEDLPFDEATTFGKDQWQAVCGNTYRMLRHSRYRRHFEFHEGRAHLGPFAGCGSGKPFAAACGTPAPSSQRGGCC